MAYNPCSNCSGAGFVPGVRGGGSVYSSDFCTACGGTGSEYAADPPSHTRGYYESPRRDLAPTQSQLSPVPNGDPEDPAYRDAVVRWFHVTHGDYPHRLLLLLKDRDPKRFKAAIRTIRDGRAAEVRAYLPVWYAGKERPRT